MRQPALLVLAVLLVAVLAPGGAAAATNDSSTLTDATTTVGVHLQSNGDARWTVSVHYPLRDDSDRRAFQRLADDFERGTRGPTLSTFRAAADAADDGTNRTMSITDGARTSAVADGSPATGTLTLAFTWTNFANASDGRVVVGDVFDESWFGPLYDGQTLRVYPPDGYSPDSADPPTQLSDGALTWHGPQSFPSGGPTVVFVAGGTIPWLLVGALLVGALLVGGAMAYVWRGFDGFGHGDGADGAADARDDGGATSGERGGAADARDDPAGDDAASASGDDVGSGGAAAEAELLSDEERVERLLAENGGRMKQANIVAETKWSDAKVSQLLSAMAEEERVEKLRLGRENLISLPDEDAPDGGETDAAE